MKYFFTLLFTLLFTNYLMANQHYTLQNSIFIAIVNADKGHEQYKSKEYEESIKTFELALESIQKYGTIGRIHNEIKSNGNQNHILGKTVANNKMVSYVRYYLHNRIGLSNIGKCQQSRENGEVFCNRAITSFNKAIEFLDNTKKKKYYRVYFNKGLAYTFMHMYDEAGRNFREAIKRNPSFVDAYNSLGIVYSRQALETRRKEETKRLLNAAKYKFNMALKYDYENEDALNNLGETEYRLKQYTRAIKNYSKAIHINPIDPVLYSNRGLAYEKQKKYTEACHNYNIAIKLQNKNPNRGNYAAQDFFNNLVVSGYCSPLPEIEGMFEPIKGGLKINQ